MSQENFQLHDWLVKPDSNELIKDGRSNKLDHKVMQLLVYFAAKAGKELSKEEILHAVWGEGVFSEEVLTVAVSSLRKALGDDSRSPKFIKTLPRYGYCMLVAPSALANAPQKSRLLEVLNFLESRIGLRFLIVALIIIFFLIVLLSKKHLH